MKPQVDLMLDSSVADKGGQKVLKQHGPVIRVSATHKKRAHKMLRRDELSNLYF